MKSMFLVLLFVFSLSTWGRCMSFSPCIEFEENNEKNFVRVAPTEASLQHLESEEDDVEVVYKKDTPYNEFLGIPYQFGGEGKEGIDCSSFTQKYFRKLGISLGRSSREQFNGDGLEEVRVEDLKNNDLLFFKENPSEEISHVAVYIGDGKMVHSSKREGGVAISDFANSSFWKKRFYKAKRIL